MAFHTSSCLLLVSTRHLRPSHHQLAQAFHWYRGHYLLCLKSCMFWLVLTTSKTGQSEAAFPTAKPTCVATWSDRNQPKHLRCFFWLENMEITLTSLLRKLLQKCLIPFRILWQIRGYCLSFCWLLSSPLKRFLRLSWSFRQWQTIHWSHIL